MNVSSALSANPAMPRIGSRTSEIRDAAVKLVSDGLVLPAVSMLHDSPLRPKTGPFAPSTLEKRFAPLLHAQLADRITAASNFPLVESIADRFERLSSARKHEVFA